MPHRAGGKITGSHTTLNDQASMIVDFLDNLVSVEKIIIGILKNMPGKKCCTTSAKIIDENKCCVLVRVSHNSTVQELRFYTNTDPQTAKLALARFVRDQGWLLGFLGDQDKKEKRSTGNGYKNVGTIARGTRQNRQEILKTLH